jgi:hypothetical protein
MAQGLAYILVTAKESEGWESSYNGERVTRYLDFDSTTKTMTGRPVNKHRKG